MRLAIATVNEKVSAHFGHCDGFTVYTVENDEVKEKEFLESPKHQRGVLPKFLSDNNVDTIAAGGMGQRAQDLFNQKNINVIVGAEGDLEKTVEKYLNNELVSTDSVCEDHQHLRQDEGECEEN